MANHMQERSASSSTCTTRAGAATSSASRKRRTRRRASSRTSPSRRRAVIRPVFETAGALLEERGHRYSIVEQEFASGAEGRTSEAGITLRIVPLGTKAPLHEDQRSLAIATRHYNKTVWINSGESAASGGLAGLEGCVRAREGDASAHRGGGHRVRGAGGGELGYIPQRCSLSPSRRHAAAAMPAKASARMPVSVGDAVGMKIGAIALPPTQRRADPADEGRDRGAAVLVEAQMNAADPAERASQQDPDEGFHATRMGCARPAVGASARLATRADGPTMRRPVHLHRESGGERQ